MKTILMYTDECYSLFHATKSTIFRANFIFACTRESDNKVQIPGGGGGGGAVLGGGGGAVVLSFFLHT